MDFTLTDSLPLFFDDQTLVVDVNMGEGDFVKGCLDKGVGMVYGFEGNDEKFITAENKLADFSGRTKLYKQTVCRSDKNTNTDATRFDFIVSHLPRVDMLKLNGGKEIYPILMTSKYLDNIGSIIGIIYKPTKSPNAPKSSSEYSVGKLHQPKMKDLKKYLEINGFNFLWVKTVEGDKHFAAWRNGPCPFVKYY